MLQNTATPIWGINAPIWDGGDQLAPYGDIKRPSFERKFTGRDSTLSHICNLPPLGRRSIGGLFFRHVAPALQRRKMDDLAFQNISMPGTYRSKSE
jgi:hypothetical protein